MHNKCASFSPLNIHSKQRAILYSFRELSCNEINVKYLQQIYIIVKNCENDLNLYLLLLLLEHNCTSECLNEANYLHMEIIQCYMHKELIIYIVLKLCVLFIVYIVQHSQKFLK